MRRWREILHPVRSRSRWPACSGQRGSAAADDPLRLDQLRPESPESAFFRPEAPHDPAVGGVELGGGDGGR